MYISKTLSDLDKCIFSSIQNMLRKYTYEFVVIHIQQIFALHVVLKQ